MDILSNKKITFGKYKDELFNYVLSKVPFGCADCDGEIPDPIPNSEVKPVSGDGTALLSVGE